MGITLITGPAGSGKTTAALETIVNRPPLEAAVSVRYVVPTTEAVRRVEEMLMERTGRPAVLGNVVTTFFGLTAELIAAKGLSGKLISDIRKDLTLRRLADSADLEYLKESARTPGFIGALDKIIGELKVSLVMPQDLRAALDGAKDRLPAEAFGKISELAELYRSYQDQTLLAHELHDREGLMWRALDIIKHEPFPLTHVVFDGFEEMNGVEREFLAVLADKITHVTATLTYEADRPAVFSAIESVRRFMLDLGAEETALEARTTTPAALAYLERNLFRDDVPVLEAADGGVTVFESCDRAMEVEMAALEIRRLVFEEGFSISDVALTTRTVGGYADLVERVMTEHDIPVAPGKRPLAETAPARLLLCAGRIVKSGWPRVEVVRFLKSELVADTLGLACRAEIDAKRAGIVAGRDKWLDSWGEHDKTHVFRLAVLKLVKDFEKGLSSAKTTDQRAQAARHLIDGFRCGPGQDAAALKELYVILDEIESSTGLIGEAGTADFLEVLEQSISLSEYEPPAPPGALRLLPVADLPGGRYSAVFLLGLLEGDFPRQIREEPFLRDRERARLNALLGDRLKLRGAQADLERRYFYGAVGAARERLYLSYPLTDEAGRESLPSFYIDEIHRLLEGFPKIRRDHTQLSPDLVGARSRAALRRAITYSLSRQAGDEGSEAALAYNALSQDERAGFARVFSDSRERPALLADEDVLTGFSKDRTYSCTELEAYAACPFMHFCAHTLGLEPDKDEIGGLDVGILLHAVLFRLFDELIDSVGSELRVRRLDERATIDRAARILDEEFNDAVRLANMPVHEAADLRHDLEMRLRRYLTGEIRDGWEGFAPTYLELAFGIPAKEGRVRDPRSVDEPLLLRDTKDRTLAVAGKMDRVDISARGALVIDYKAGASPRIGRVHKGLVFQAVLYALALKKVFGLEPAGTEYRPIKAWSPDGYYRDGTGDFPTKRLLDEEAFSSLLDECQSQLVELGARLRSGSIAVEPLDCKSYCAFSHICRIDKVKSEHSDPDAVEGTSS